VSETVTVSVSVLLLPPDAETVWSDTVIVSVRVLLFDEDVVRVSATWIISEGIVKPDAFTSTAASTHLPVEAPGVQRKWFETEIFGSIVLDPPVTLPDCKFQV